MSAYDVETWDRGGKRTDSRKAPIPDGYSGAFAQPVSGMTADLNQRFGFVGDDRTNNDAAFARWFGAVVAGTTSPYGTLWPGIYRHGDPLPLAQPGLDFVRLDGLAGGPAFNQTPNPRRQVVLKYMGAQPSNAIDAVWKGETIQSGFHFQWLTFVNGGNPANTCWEIDQYNNWELARCGWQGYRIPIVSRANDDNAHGEVRRCLANIPKPVGGELACFAYIVGKTAAAGGSGAGFVVNHCSISGDVGSVGIYGDRYAADATVTGGTKIDGTTGGAIVYKGRYLCVSAVRCEGAGDPTHPMIDVQHDPSYRDSGRGAIIDNVHLVGRDKGELYGRFGPGTFANQLGLWYGEAGAAELLWADEGSYNWVTEPQLGRALATVPRLAATASTAQIVAALQARRDVTP